LIIELTNQNRLDEYYNAEQQTVEHFRFRQTFIRRTKKSFHKFRSQWTNQKGRVLFARHARNDLQAASAVRIKTAVRRRPRVLRQLFNQTFTPARNRFRAGTHVGVGVYAQLFQPSVDQRFERKSVNECKRTARACCYAIISFFIFL